MKEKLREIDALMRKRGIMTDPKTGKEYFTGYSYAQLYDWDQYFESIVQLYLGWGTKYPKNTIEIFLDYQDEIGFSPRGVGHSNGCKEQESEMVKPFLSQIALLIYNRDGNLDFLTENYYEKLKKYMLYWVRRAEENGNLAYWNSSVHSGMDNQHERAGYWMDNFCCGVDLNCYLSRECKAFSIIAKLKNKPLDASWFLDFSKKIANAIQERLWNKEEQIYYDLNKNTNEQIRVKYIGAFMPLWLGIATNEQAAALISKHLENEKEFNRNFPYPALAASEKGYSETLLPADISYVCNWRANTWIPTNYIVFHGLKNYGYDALAKRLADLTYKNVCEIGNREYFTTETKQGCGCNPFWGWTLLAYFMPFENMMNIDPTVIKEEKMKIVLM